jgi:hypothetical protein
MSPQSNKGEKAFLAGTALSRAVRVKLSSGTVIVTGAGEEGIGVTLGSADSGDHVTVGLDHETREVTASGAITAGGNLYAAASGAMSHTISGRRLAVALEAASSGALFEAMVSCVTS